MEMLRRAKLRARALEEPAYRNEEQGLSVENEVHELLQNMREQAGISRTELARRLEITPPAITRLEKRPAQASITTLNRYAEACGFTLFLFYK
ncbi:hypothetical protein AwEntero_30900 [Enterobacterales bacterium]|nr:hypothetical protein AwEntero_30900 [Enterobacterales bacterium]